MCKKVHNTNMTFFQPCFPGKTAVNFDENILYNHVNAYNEFNVCVTLTLTHDKN